MLVDRGGANSSMPVDAGEWRKLWLHVLTNPVCGICGKANAEWTDADKLDFFCSQHCFVVNCVSK
eukprot:11087449-Karenia_brevis.AAC.1